MKVAYEVQRHGNFTFLLLKQKSSIEAKFKKVRGISNSKV